MKIKYFVRLDDACPTMVSKKWDEVIDFLLDYGVYPLIGVIPDNRDDELKNEVYDPYFWNKIRKWEKQGCIIAQHGYSHVYMTKESGINPVQDRSEFAGVSYDVQVEKIKLGYEKLISEGLNIKCFFAPSHTFDLNTLKALKRETAIRYISDTIARKSYSSFDFTFFPVQGGSFRKILIPGEWTFCFHPNNMSPASIETFKSFIKNNHCSFYPFALSATNRKKDCIDFMLKKFYFFYRKLRSL